MGYRGKVVEQERARELRAESWTLQEIAGELGVSKVSVWVRDVEFVPKPRQPGAHRRPHPWVARKEAEIAELLEEGRRRIGRMTDQELLVAGTALYAGEGSKTPGEVRFANSDPRMIQLFCVWLRRFFDVDESRLRMRLYLHERLDLDAATAFWSELCEVPPEQFHKPYRAVVDPSICQRPVGSARRRPAELRAGGQVNRAVVASRTARFTMVSPGASPPCRWWLG